MSISRRIQSALGAIVYATGLPRLLHKDRIVIVAFHRVNERTAGDALTVSPSAFRAYCKFFARNFTVLPLDQLLDGMESGQLPPRPLAITFDDGYEDNFQYAAPILRELGLPSTFFISSGFVGSTTVAPWDRKKPVHSWMGWEQVRALASDGFEIGGHTVNHVNLGQVEGDAARAEIDGGRRQLQEHCGQPVKSFAYPFGGPDKITEANRALIAELGFRACLSCHGGVNKAGTDPYHLRRVPISDWYLSHNHLALALLLGRV